MPGLILESRQEGETTIVSLIGDGGVANSRELEIGLTKLVAQHPKMVVLEMSRFEFISSLGMGTLVAFRKGVAMRGGKVAMAGLTQLVRDALTRARMETLFPMHETVEAALAV